jgi:hypothetical protein
MFYYIALKYGNFLLETLDTFPLLKDAYTQSRKLYENRISSWYGALQQILNLSKLVKDLRFIETFTPKFSIYYQNSCSYLGSIDAYVLLEVFS